MKHVILALLAICFSSLASGEGRVLFVIGSDTGLWTGLNVARYHCTLSGALYTDPAMNASRVMDPAFRSALTDRHGTPMKLTWWMMAGNMFRLSTNTDIPVPSTMPAYLMKHFHGERIRQWNDEVSFHYHDWVWTDDNGDGVWYWNQAKTYGEYVPDFDQTLGEILVEEEIFPVSFRSGWHAMNNEWQQRLDRLLPFSMHNDWPAVHNDATEPIDNIYDWSRAPSTFIPFHPSLSDYQVPGNARGWNLRSSYITEGDSAFLVRAFAEAARGVDQVVCLWAHLPETDFPDNLQKLNAAVHAAAARYPAIDYRYCTAVEAMQNWLRTADTTAPGITIEEAPSGSHMFWTIRTAEPIFQPEPFVVAKDRNERYRLIALTATGPQEWTTVDAVPRADLAKFGVAVTDTAGNQTIRLIRYLPDDLFIDNLHAGYTEPRGSWSTVSGTGFDASFRIATPGPADSATARWDFTIHSAGLYNIFLRIPATAKPVGSGRITWGQNGVEQASLFASPLPADAWHFIGTMQTTSGVSGHVEVTAFGGQEARTFAADAVKVTAYVRERWVEAPESVDAGSLIVGEPADHPITVRNSGVSDAHVLSALTVSGASVVVTPTPATVPAMGACAIDLRLTPAGQGSFLDTLILTTDDPLHPTIRIGVHGLVQEYFTIADDGDATRYHESGVWAFSSAGGYNSTSRYAYPASGVFASFSVRLKRPGTYDISAIVPTTVNASIRARYTLLVGPNAIDSIFRDQNAGSGDWTRLWQRELPADTTITVQITDAMVPVVPGKVLRADAVQFQWTGSGTTASGNGTIGIPGESALHQNYPNPFNPATHILLSVVRRQRTRVSVFDILGREIAVLLDDEAGPGEYRLTFRGEGLATGIYVCRMRTSDREFSRKMLLMR